MTEYVCSSLDDVWWVFHLVCTWWRYRVFIGAGFTSNTEPDYWHIICIMRRVWQRLSLEAQPVTVQIYCLSTQWENIDLLSLTHLISCAGDTAFHLSPWQRKWGGKHSNSLLLSRNEALEHCRLITSGKPLSKQECLYHSWLSHWHLSAQLVSTESQHLTAFLTAECAAAWEWCTPTVPLWFYSLVVGDLSVYLQCWRFTPFSFVCKQSGLTQSAASAVCKPGHNESTLHLTQQDSSTALFF